MSRPSFGTPIALVALCALAAAPGCRGGKSSAPELGQAAGHALQRGIAAALTTTAPWPCAALDPASSLTPVQPAGWQINGLELVPRAASATAEIGFIADAGGATPAALEQLRRATAAFTAAGASMVVSLGGMASDREQLERVLGALTTDAPYLLLAIPGDLEPVAEHRAAIAALQRQGRRVVDGSVVRWARLGVATIATLPGARHSGELPAGDEGCGFDDPAIEATLGVLDQAQGHKLLASWTSPRPGATTMALGDLPLRQAMERHHIDLAVVGEPTNSDSAGDGTGRPGSHAQILFSGFSDAEPRLPVAGRLPRPAVLMLHLTRADWRWQRLDLSMQPSP